MREQDERQNEATADLWRTYATTRALADRDALVTQYLPLVHGVVRRQALAASSSLTRDDLLGYGHLGLLEAIQRFDPERGIRFETYALQRIRGTIIDAFRQLDPVSRGTRRQARTLDTAEAHLEQTLGRAPVIAEVAEHLGLSDAEARHTREQASRVLLSLDRPVSMQDGDNSLTVGDTIEDRDGVDAQAALERQEEHAALTRAVGTLNERDRLVLSLYYYEELTLREVSEVLGVTESRVCQLHARALRRLKQALEAPAGARVAA